MKFLDPFGNQKKNPIFETFQNLETNSQRDIYELILHLFSRFGWEFHLLETNSANGFGHILIKNNIEILSWYEDQVQISIGLWNNQGFADLSKVCIISHGRFILNYKSISRHEFFNALLNMIRLL